MKIAISHMQLDMLGGGERVALTMADELSKNGHEVFVYAITEHDKTFLGNYYNLQLDNVRIINNSGLPSLLKGKYRSYIFSKILSKKTDFDLIIDTGSNGFYPIKTQAKSICYVHFLISQKPVELYKKIYLLPIYNKIGYSFDHYDAVLCNSVFTRNYVRKLTSKPIEVIYPPIKRMDAKSNNIKENIIITVGRIAAEKRMGFLIQQFKKLYKFSKAWSFFVVGSLSNKEYYRDLSKMSEGLPIYFISNISHKELFGMYSKAMIYWHAKGYGKTDPTLFEHFGITTVEAMSQGCVPIVLDKGGQREIVDHGVDGFRWNTEDELCAYTRKVMNREVDVEAMKESAIKKSKDFDEKIFRRKIRKIVEG